LFIIVNLAFGIYEAAAGHMKILEWPFAQIVRRGAPLDLKPACSRMSSRRSPMTMWRSV
jgi:hypothetical protein